MKPSELRIGNLISVNDEVVEVSAIQKEAGDYQLSAIDHNKRTMDIFIISICKPIPLTDKWLDKLGFEDNKLDDFHIEYDDHAGYGILYGGNFLTGVEYVHEVQNLYFCIYAQELEIK